MIRFLFAALVLLWAGASHAGPKASLSVQVVPTGGGSCGTIAGQAGIDAAAAGFNTCVLYNDFTTQIPNNVGTGLPNNWLNCNGGVTDTNAVWNAYGDVTVPCPASYTQLRDTGGGGNLALDMHYDHAWLMQATEFDNMAFMATVPPGPGTSNPNTHTWSNGYFEITERTTADTVHFPGEQQAFWSWNKQAYITNGFVEQDFFEDWASGGQSMDNAWVFWIGNQTNNGFKANPRYPAHVQAEYHTFGALITGDNNNFAVCNYFDGARVGCTQQSYSGSQSGSQRRDVRVQSGAQCNTPTYGDISCVGNSFNTVDMYVQDVKVMVCPSETTGGACLNSNFSNGMFYTP